MPVMPTSRWVNKVGSRSDKLKPKTTAAQLKRALDGLSEIDPTRPEGDTK